MFELIQSGGLLVWLIILCSVVSVAIVIERFWTLKKNAVTPFGLMDQVEKILDEEQLDPSSVAEIRRSSPLGRILAAGMVNIDQHRVVMKEAIEEAGRHVIHDLERYLNALGTIAAITPLLGLLGTVIGMIDVFAAITTSGVGNPAVLAGGISKALITTAAGLTVGIPSLMFHRYFRGRVTELAIDMEQEALRFLEFVHGERNS
ncbi:MAG: MotA/TolQ/ExbB proton channel family protein [Proteobacteria bacterium]|nr:MAG: MotA/TolQ/ExbB proton channel family protein [Pseudomonadota bacterium]